MTSLIRDDGDATRSTARKLLVCFVVLSFAVAGKTEMRVAKPARHFLETIVPKTWSRYFSGWVDVLHSVQSKLPSNMLS